jgi:hypothetical protein
MPLSALTGLYCETLYCRHTDIRSALGEIDEAGSSLHIQSLALDGSRNFLAELRDKYKE